MRLILSFEALSYIAVVDKIICVDFSNTVEPKEFEFPDGKGSNIVSIDISSNGQYLFAAYANKWSCCWDTSSREIVGRIVLKKRPISISYANFGISDFSGATSDSGSVHEVLVVADKGGDVWGTNAPTLTKSLVSLAGHTSSVLTDLIKIENFIISSDRDEKIRVTKFPSMVTIQSYCLGHDSVVTSISEINLGGNKLLLSIGWDHKLVLWDFLTGCILANYVYPNKSIQSIPVCDVEDNDCEEVTESPSKKAKSTAVHLEEIVEGDIAESNISLGDTNDIPNENNDETERTYDEDGAGNFPIKITTFSSYCAVIFKGSNEINLHDISCLSNEDEIGNPHAQSSANGAIYAFRNQGSITLPDIPIDICFTTSGILTVLMPKPYYMYCYSISSDSSSSSSSAFNIVHLSQSDSDVEAVTQFVSCCTEQGIEMTQQSISAHEGQDADKGMKKHSLDKRFDRNKNIKGGRTRNR